MNQHISFIQDMAIFVAVVKAGSFSEAARQLGYSPSSVSRSIKQLEKELGVCLLQRTTRKLRLSDYGKEVYQHCLAMDNAAQNAVGLSSNRLASEKGLIRVSAPKAVAYSLLHPHIPAFLNDHPDIDVQLILNDDKLDLIDHKIDLMFLISNNPPQGMIGRKLQTITHVICATEHYLHTHGEPSHPRDLEKHSCITLGETAADSKWRFNKGNRVAQVQVNGRYSANHTRVRLEAMLNHLGIASLPYFVAKDALDNGQAKQILSEWSFHTAYCGDLWMLSSATKYPAIKVKKFADHIATQFASGPVN